MILLKRTVTRVLVICPVPFLFRLCGFEYLGPLQILSCSVARPCAALTSENKGLNQREHVSKFGLKDTYILSHIYSGRSEPVLNLSMMRIVFLPPSQVMLSV